MAPLPAPLPAPARAHSSALSATRPLALVLGTGALVVACGGAPPAAPPPAVVKPVAAAEKAPPPDVSPVARPASMVAQVRLSKPDRSLKTAGDWSRLPIPGADAVGNLMSGAPIGKVLDLSQPIDLVIAIDGPPRSPRPRVAVSAAVTSLEDARGAFARYKVAPGPDGATRITGLGDAEDEDERTCDLAPAAGSAPVRLVCGDSPAAVNALGPWLLRSAPREAFPSDLHVDVRIAPLRPTVQAFRGMLPMLLSTALDARGAPPPISQALDALVGEVADLSADLEQLTVDLELADPGADATIAMSFGGATATVSRIALAHPERADVPPSAFWHTPGDADVAYYTRGVDPKDIAHARELARGALGAALEKQGLPEGDRKALVEPLMRCVDLYTGPLVYAKGVDMPAVQGARARVDAAKDDAARATAEQALAAELAGWSIMQTPEPLQKVTPIAKELVAALGRPAVAKLAKGDSAGAAASGGAKTKGGPAPTAKIVPLPKNASLPKESVHLEISAYDERDAPAVTTGGKGTKGAAAAKVPAKPRVLHALLVPDGAATWIATAPSLPAAVAKVTAALASAPESGTLAKRGGSMRCAQGVRRRVRPRVGSSRRAGCFRRRRCAT